jgi:hypothetical protein
VRVRCAGGAGNARGGQTPVIPRFSAGGTPSRRIYGCDSPDELALRFDLRRPSPYAPDVASYDSAPDRRRRHLFGQYWNRASRRRSHSSLQIARSVADNLGAQLMTVMSFYDTNRLSRLTDITRFEEIFRSAQDPKQVAASQIEEFGRALASASQARLDTLRDKESDLFASATRSLLPSRIGLSVVYLRPQNPVQADALHDFIYMTRTLTLAAIEVAESADQVGEAVLQGLDDLHAFLLEHQVVTEEYLQSELNENDRSVHDEVRRRPSRAPLNELALAA